MKRSPPRWTGLAALPRLFALCMTAHWVAAQSDNPPDRALSPAQGLRSVRVPAGYQVDLIAAEPLTLDPVAIDWDERGRLWVVEMADYPLGLDTDGKPGGRIRILEDTDGDGRMDRSTVFAEGLSFPTGLITWRDGVVVTAAPDILFLRDTTGDGSADERQVWVTGLSTGNQQLRANGLRWGLDGWLYCAAGGHYVGYASQTRLQTATQQVAVGSRDFRFRPDTGALEPVSGPSQFGRERDDWGHWFGTQNSRALWHVVLPDTYLRRNPHLPASDPTHLVVGPINAPVWPASTPEKRFHSYENAGHFTSACSGMIYRDTLLFPGDPSVRHAFTCEPFHNLVQYNRVLDHGVTFSSERDPLDSPFDFFASTDRWCRPVMVRTGPDGALWVVDMYRYIIEHPDWLPESGRIELLPHYRLGDDRGRIYRVRPGAAPSVGPAARSGRDPFALFQGTIVEKVAGLTSSNGWLRDKLHQHLVLNQDPTAVPELRKLLSPDHPPVARLHALWILHEWGALEVSDLVDSLEASHPGLRLNALRLAESFLEPRILEAVAECVHDPDPKVRLQLALSLGAWTNAVAGQALAELAVDADDDRFLRTAILSSARPHRKALTQRVLKAESRVAGTWIGDLADLALADGDRDALHILLLSVLNVDGATERAFAFDSCARILEAAAKHSVSIPDLGSIDDALGTAVQRLLSKNEDSPFIRAQQAAFSLEEPMVDRIAAVRLLGRNPELPDGIHEKLAELLTPRHPAELQRAAIRAMVTTGSSEVSFWILGALDTLSPIVRAAAIEALLSREAWTMDLLRSLQEKSTLALDVSYRARLLQHTSARIREMSQGLWQELSSRGSVVERFQPALQLSGDVGRGAAVFNRLCANCHEREGVGIGIAIGIGPDLISVRHHEPTRLLVSILDPSADILPGYQAFHIELLDGTELHGRITSESDTSLSVLTVDGTVHEVQRTRIQGLHGMSRSLMPDGLETDLTPQDLADLIQYLRH